MRACIICGSMFNPRHIRHMRCSACCGLILHTCERCGSKYTVRQSRDVGRFCPACRGAASGASRNGKLRAASQAASAAAKARVAADPERAALQLQHAAEAARNSPLSGPFETNINAKVWHVRTPDGEKITVRNMALWCRETFARPDSAIVSFSRMSKALRDGKRPRPYFGYVIDVEPDFPDDYDDYKAERARRKAEREKLTADKQQSQK